MQIILHSHIRSFSDRVKPWLLRNEPEYNLPLALIEWISKGNHRFDEPLFLASIEDQGKVVGCAWRTPPMLLGIAHAPEEAIPLLAERLAGVYPSLPAVLAAEGTARSFADHWSRLTGCMSTMGLRERIYGLERVENSRPVPEGRFRPAEEDDLPLLVEWMERFAVEIGVPSGDQRTRTENLIRSQDLFLWEDSTPRCMAGVAGRSPNGIRVGYVFTPPESRSQGYARQTVALLCARALAEGSRFCFLYADLANPASNAVYRQVGFKPVADVLEIRFS